MKRTREDVGRAYGVQFIELYLLETGRHMLQAAGLSGLIQLALAVGVHIRDVFAVAVVPLRRDAFDDVTEQFF